MKFYPCNPNEGSTILFLNGFHSSDDPYSHYIYYTPHPHPDEAGGLLHEESRTEDRAIQVLFTDDCIIVKGLWGLFMHIICIAYSSIQELSVI